MFKVLENLLNLDFLQLTMIACAGALVVWFISGLVKFVLLLKINLFGIIII